MNLFNQIKKKEENISVIGLGYVGMPIAISFAKKTNVIAFDISKEKIALYKSGKDPTHEVGDKAIQHTSTLFTSDANDLKRAKFHIIAVPTPVYTNHSPNLEPLKSACKTLGRNLTKGSIVVFESTVYPGVTEDVCVPILESESGLECGIDFKVGYSPERINPGDKLHRLENITKVVSGMDSESLDIIAKVYELVVEAGVYKAESIKVAEAAKVIENSQRDINIAFMNELSIIFNKMGIDTQSVLKAAATKWNFLNFYPGLVGGHCIGIDPYYLTYIAEQIGYHSQVIIAGRRINDDMGKFVAENLVKQLIKADIPVKNARIAILGLTFKENCPDIRNSRVIDLIQELEEYGIQPLVVDPEANSQEVNELYNIKLDSLEDIGHMDAIVVAVAHNKFINMSQLDIEKLYDPRSDKKKILIDIKGIYNRIKYENENYLYWRL